VVACQQAAEAAQNDDTAVTHVDLEPSVKDRNETFRLRVEDPMFLVSQKHRETVVKHEQTKALYERVVGPTTGDDPDEDERNKPSSKVGKEPHAQSLATIRACGFIYLQSATVVGHSSSVCPVATGVTRRERTRADKQ
jgi:hypothetical protein